MEPVHPIPKRKPSVAALEKLVSDAEEMSNAATAGDNSSRGGRNLPKVPTFNASSAPLEVAIPPLSRLPTPSPTYSLSQFPNPIPQDWPYVLCDETELDASTMEALYALSDESLSDEFVFSPITPSSSDFLDWSKYNEGLGSPLLRSAPRLLEYCNIPPPNRLRGSESSLSSNTPKETSPFGILFPSISVPLKTTKTKLATGQFSEFGATSKWKFRNDTGDKSDSQSEVMPASGISDLRYDIATGLPIPFIPDFSPTEEAAAHWDLVSNNIMTNNNHSTNATIPVDATPGLEAARNKLSLPVEEEVDQYVKETLRNCTDEVKESWSAFFKGMVFKDASSKSFWLSAENAPIWASFAEPENTWDTSELQFTETDFTNINTMTGEQSPEWLLDMENFGSVGSMAMYGRDSSMELFEMDLNDPVLHQQMMMM